MNAEEWNQGRLLESSGWYWKSCTIHAGVKLDVFTVLGDQYLASRQVAEAIGGDERAVAMLLNALTAMGLIEKSDDRFHNTEAARTFLSKDSPQYLGYIITHHHHLVESWSHLDRAVYTGVPVRSRTSQGDEEWRKNFLLGMFNLAMGIAPHVAREVDLSGRRHILDLGGGPGTYGIHFCLENPQLKGTVYDLPTTKPFAQKTIEQFGLSDRMVFLAGDYVEGEITGRYDVAWLSHILHGEGQEICEQIIRKVVEVLEPGGLILVHDFFLNNTMDGPLFPTLFSLNMLLGTSAGQAYSEGQIISTLSKAGVKEIRRLTFRGPNDSGIIAGLV